jgi:transcriptional regulator with XRE-family HTH domain
MSPTPSTSSQRSGFSGPTLGERIADYRRQRGLSQRELAAEMQRSESWVSQVERDIQPVERLSVLHSLAQALGVSVRDLRPEAVPEPEPDSAVPNDLDGLRLELSGHPVLGQLFGGGEAATGPADIDQYAAEVEHAWSLAHDSRFAALNDCLTGLLTRLEHATRSAVDDEAIELHALRARAYQAASAAFARQDEPDAAWVAADRAITAAEQSGEPLAVIAGHFRLAHALIRVRHYDQASHVAATAIDALTPIAARDDASPEVLSLLGAMHLVQAVTCGHESDRRRARAHLAQATRIADRLGIDRNDYDTEFGPTNVQLHAVAVAVAVDLGDAGEALDVAARVDASGLSPERQVRLLLDVARAHAQRRHTGEAIAALVDAEQVSPEHVRSHHLAKSTIRELLDQSGRQAPTELMELARRAGATP